MASPNIKDFPPGDKKEITTFDPDVLKTKVTERVKAAIADLIPDAAFNAMVDREIKAYFEEAVPLTFDKEEIKTDGGGWFSKVTGEKHSLRFQMTPFRAHVWKAVHQQVAKKIEAILSMDYVGQAAFNGIGHNAQEAVGCKMKDIAQELAPIMVQHFFASMFNGLAADVQCAIQNRMQNGTW